VQALAGVLLPSATVFLVLLCNDRAVLGPWVNSVRQNILAWTVVWSLVLLSLALTAATFFPGLSTATLESGLATGAAIGIIGGAIGIGTARRNAHRRDAERLARDLGGLDPHQIDELEHDPATLTRAERKAILARDRATWRPPTLASLDRPVMSAQRRLGLITLRTYLLVAVALVIVKVVQTGIGG
jgi:hypothetical protein